MDIGKTVRITERPEKPSEVPAFTPPEPAEMPEWLDPNKVKTPEKVPVTVGS